MSTDRELLELAAKAVGLVLDYRRGSDAYYYDDPETGREEWNPLSRDGQALRLAVKLRFMVSVDAKKRGKWIIIYPSEHQFLAVEEEVSGDWFAATRRAIVRAAAELGRKS